MAAQIYGCHEEIFQSPHYPAQASALLKELMKTQAPRTRHNPFREEWEELTETFSSAKPTFLVLSDQALFVTGGRECIP